MQLGEKLYKLRESKNMSQEELAERLGVSRQTISNWENDKVTLDVDKAQELCNLYNIDMNTLFDVEPTQTELRKQSKGLFVALISIIVAFALLAIGCVVGLTLGDSDTSSTILFSEKSLWAVLLIGCVGVIVGVTIVLVKKYKSK
ncbi:MAG: helix-turn-helix domain-containing protein [Clostridia bacterium]|nr:helix-turn-helix domain-containing protein [Clostridia bacterium]